MIDRGAEYLYTDSEMIYNRIELAPYFDKLIFDQGTIKVFSLKKSN